MRHLLLLIGVFFGSWLCGHLLSGLHGPTVTGAHYTRDAHYPLLVSSGHRKTRRSPDDRSAQEAQAPAAPTSAHAPNDAFELVALDNVLPDIAQARTLRVAAYFLDERSAIVRMMAEDAARHAQIETILTGDGEGYAVRSTTALAQEYPAFHVTMTTGPAHLKAIVIDNQTAYLGDRNFGRGTLTLRVPDRDVNLVNAAIDQRVDQGDGLTFRKDLALMQEAGALRTARSSIDIESESFDSGSVIYRALEMAIAHSVHIRLVVKGGEAHVAALDQLRSEAPSLIQIVRAQAADKIAIIDNRLAWVGSANATPELGEQRDWGYVTHDPRLISQLEERFTENAR